MSLIQPSLWVLASPLQGCGGVASRGTLLKEFVGWEDGCKEPRGGPEVQLLCRAGGHRGEPRWDPMDSFHRESRGRPKDGKMRGAPYKEVGEPQRSPLQRSPKDPSHHQPRAGGVLQRGWGLPEPPSPAPPPGAAGFQSTGDAIGATGTLCPVLPPRGLSWGSRGGAPLHTHCRKSLSMSRSCRRENSRNSAAGLKSLRPPPGEPSLPTARIAGLPGGTGVGSASCCCCCSASPSRIPNRRPSRSASSSAMVPGWMDGWTNRRSSAPLRPSSRLAKGGDASSRGTPSTSRLGGCQPARGPPLRVPPASAPRIVWW